MQIVSLSLEKGMLLDVQHDVEVTRRATVEPTLSVSREADTGSIFYAGWNVSVHRSLTQHPAFTFAFDTGIGDHIARALAGFCPGRRLNLDTPHRSHAGAP